jgi:hypothetical protein
VKVLGAMTRVPVATIIVVIGRGNRGASGTAKTAPLLALTLETSVRLFPPLEC